MKPILIFSEPDIQSERENLSGNNIPRPITPSHSRQVKRLSDRFSRLRDSFNNGVFSSDPAGFLPERTLVFETIGPVEDFYSAAAKIEGLGPLHDLIGDEFESNEDFYFDDNQDKKLKGHLYLTLANQTALNQLLSFWGEFQENENYEFPHGYKSLKNLFSHLQTIRYWDTEDRLRETHLIEDWKIRLSEEQKDIPVEIELWDKGNSKYIESENRVRGLVRDLGGEVLGSCRIQEILYHALQVKIPSEAVETIINEKNYDIQLFRCDDVMYFRPTGQCSSPVYQFDEIIDEDEIVDEEDVDTINEPVVALLDGLPLENHSWIKDKIIIDDPDGWSDDYSPQEQLHGTSMASLIIRGDMVEAGEINPRKIYCRPIMKPVTSGFGDSKIEMIPEGILPIDIVHRAVIRLFESHNEDAPIAPTVKVINLSVADPYRLFDKVMSPWAKLVDYLSEKYNVLFVISPGNHTQSIKLEVTNDEFEKLNQEDKEKLIIQAIAKDSVERRLMSPSESINSITVGASHSDLNTEDDFINEINPYKDRNMPSTINPISEGKKRTVKPEVLMPGGRATYKLKGYMKNDIAELEIISNRLRNPPGQKVAIPGGAASIKSYAYTFGTSNATALATRRLSFLYETIKDLYNSESGDILSADYETVLLKAMLCHGASLDDRFDWVKNIFINYPNITNYKAATARFAGFGNVNEERIHGCLESQATILQCGNIKGNSKHIYKFPLPSCLNGIVVDKRLIVTLAWFSPIKASSTNSYRQAHLYFKPPNSAKSIHNPLNIESSEMDSRMVKNGTVQHEVLHGDKASVYTDDEYIYITVNCKYHNDKKSVHVPYGLVVTLDTPNADLPIYEEVKNRLQLLHAQQATRIK